MRSLIFAGSMLVAVAALGGCGTPTVELPPGSNQTTSDSGPIEISPPAIQSVPDRYPYAKLALRGTANNAVRILISGIGNPVAATVQPLDGTFCVDVLLAASPAHYTIEVRSQGGDGTLSAVSTVKVERDKDAPAPSGAQLCDGSPAGT